MVIGILDRRGLRLGQDAQTHGGQRILSSHGHRLSAYSTVHGGVLDVFFLFLNVSSLKSAYSAFFKITSKTGHTI